MKITVQKVGDSIEISKSNSDQKWCLTLTKAQAKSLARTLVAMLKVNA